MQLGSAEAIPIYKGMAAGQAPMLQPGQPMGQKAPTEGIAGKPAATVMPSPTPAKTRMSLEDVTG